MPDDRRNAASLAAFSAAERSLRAVGVRPEVVLEELAAPTSLAPFGLGLVATVLDGDDEAASGRFVLLHDPAEPAGWGGGAWRIVTYARGAVRPDHADDPEVAGGGWARLQTALDDRGARHAALAGAVTRVVDQRFGQLAPDGAGEPATVDLEIRASWSPLATPEGIGVHLLAFADVLAGLAGLTPTPAGVAILPRSWR